MAWSVLTKAEVQLVGVDGAEPVRAALTDVAQAYRNFKQAEQMKWDAKRDAGVQFRDAVRNLRETTEAHLAKLECP